MRHWTRRYRGQLVHLFNDSATAVTIFQAGKGKDAFIQTYIRELWLACVQFDITLGVSHTLREGFTHVADAPSCWHMGQHYKDWVNLLVQDRRVEIQNIDITHIN